MSDELQTVSIRECRGLINNAKNIYLLVQYGDHPDAVVAVQVSRPQAKQVCDHADELAAELKEDPELTSEDRRIEIYIDRPSAGSLTIGVVFDDSEDEEEETEEAEGDGAADSGEDEIA